MEGSGGSEQRIALTREGRSARSVVSCWPRCDGWRAWSRSTPPRRRSAGLSPSTRMRSTLPTDPVQVETYFAAAIQAALALAAFRAPYRGRSTPVNAWWGSFDLAVNLFSGETAEPPAKDFIMRNAMDARRSPSGGGLAMRATTAPRSTLTRTQRPTALPVATWSQRRRAGSPRWRVRARLGGRPQGGRPLRSGGPIRPLGISPQLRSVPVGSRPRCECRRPATAGALSGNRVTRAG